MKAASLAIAAIFVVGVGYAGAADLSPGAPPPIAPYNWTGFYFGAQVGGAAGTANFADPFGGSVFGDKVTTPGFFAGGQIGYNWQLPDSRWVLGVQADADWITADGTNTCFAASGFVVSATCHADPRAFGTVTARGGYAFGPDGRTLLYAKGGMAWINEQADATANAGLYGLGNTMIATVATGTFTRSGWTVGAGIERAVAPGWTVFLEYDYLNFSRIGFETPGSVVQSPPGGNNWAIISPTATTFSQDIHEAKLGVNYKFGADPRASWHGEAAAPAFAKAPPQPWLPGWSFDSGARVWFSSGKFQWDPNVGLAGAAGNSDVSRLTYDGLTGYTGEIFERIDSPNNVFVKGNLGLGTINGGHVNDEDWLLFGGTVPYSNTLGSTDNGKLGYGTVDVGYDFLIGPGYKAGPFVGYNYFTERWNTFGCAQIANALSDCVPSLSTSTLAGNQTSTWQSLRVGLNGEMTLADRLELSADVAYLPYVSMTGRDNHVLFTPTEVFDQQGTGQGVQFEAILSYFVTANFSVGIGGRYWAMWTTSGTDTCTNCGGAGIVSASGAAKFNTERYGGFVQAAYKFGAPDAVIK